MKSTSDLRELKGVVPEKIIDDMKKAFAEFRPTEAQKKRAIEKLIEIYKKSCFEPGEAAGVVTAQSISEPGTQMSLDAKEKIIIRHKDAISIQEIGNFTDTAIKRFGSISENEWEIADISSMDIYVPSISQDEKIEWKRVLACSRHESPEKLLKIKTRSGREIIATNSHSFVVRKNNRIVAVSGKSLKCGERIPSVKLLPENCIDSLTIKDIAEHEFLRARRKLPEIFLLNEIAGWLFGAYISEGNCVQNFVCISNIDEIFLEKTRQFARSFGLTYNEYDNLRGFAKGHDIHINSVLLSAILAKTCGKGSKNKRIPDFAYSANEKFVKALLQAFFEGDGNISLERKVIRASSNSKELIDGLALLLARFGIFSYKGKGKQYTIVIPAKYALVFREKIGFVSAEKAKKLDELCKSSSRQDYIEMVSGFDDLFARTARKLCFPIRFVNNFTKRQKIGKETLLRYIVLFGNMANEKGVDISEELGIMKTMHSSDVVWDEIVEIEFVEPSSRYVNDLTVEGTETFTTFEGIVTHNTMRSYHIAGAAKIQVTLGLPRLIEIFDARRTPTTPSMTIYLQKSYNTRDKAKAIAAEIKETKLDSVTSESAIDLLNMQIELTLDTKMLNEVKLTPVKIAKILKEATKDINIKLKQNCVQLKPKTEISMKELQKLKTKILNVHLKGVKGISQVIVDQEKEEWVIRTLGTNLAKVFQIQGVDIAKTTTNDIYEVLKVLGVEAARYSIIKEAMRTLEEQGLDVDIRHIMLVADAMTVDGTIKAIGRYGVAGAKGSVLARANFEETIKHLTKASVVGEIDKLESIVENVMINQVVPIGTGMFELTFKKPQEKK